jgi:hypothetical protein
VAIEWGFAAFGYSPWYRLPDAIAEMKRLYRGS